MHVIKMSRDEVEFFRKVFTQLDVDGDGKVEFSELEAVVCSLISDEPNIFRNIRYDMLGYSRFPDFLSVISTYKQSHHAKYEALRLACLSLLLNAGKYVKLNIIRLCLPNLGDEEVLPKPRKKTKVHFQEQSIVFTDVVHLGLQMLKNLEHKQ